MTRYDLRNTPLFRECGPAFFDAIEGNAQYKNHKKGKILLIHGEPAERFYLIKSGWVKLFRETLDGTQAVIDILPAGQFFGETSIFENGTHPFSAEVVEASEIISLPLSNLKAEIENNNKLALNMLHAMARYHRMQENEIERRSLQNAPQRIGCFLLRLTNQKEAGPVKIHLPYDKTLVASRLGMQPETFSRALAKLREKTHIRIKGATIEIDNLNQLIQYSCTACSSKFPCKKPMSKEKVA